MPTADCKLWCIFEAENTLHSTDMKQSPFKFQGNSSVKGKGKKATGTPEHDETKGKQSPLPKDQKKVLPKVKMNTNIRTARPVNTQRPKAK